MLHSRQPFVNDVLQEERKHWSSCDCHSAATGKALKFQFAAQMNFSTDFFTATSIAQWKRFHETLAPSDPSERDTARSDFLRPTAAIARCRGVSDCGSRDLAHLQVEMPCSSRVSQLVPQL